MGIGEHRKDIVRIVINTGKVGEDGIGDELGLLLGRGVEHDELGVDRIAERFSRVGKRPYDTIGVVDVEPGQLGLQSWNRFGMRSEEHTSELQSLMRNSYAVFCLKKKNVCYGTKHNNNSTNVSYINSKNV